MRSVMRVLRSWLLCAAIFILPTALSAQEYAELDPAHVGSGITIGPDGITATSSTYATPVYSTLSQASGKHYAEIRLTAGSDLVVGVSSTRPLSTYIGWASDGSQWSWASGPASEYSPPAGELYHYPTHSSYGSGADTGDVVGIAVDVDAGKVWFSKNGVWQGGGNPAAGTSPAFTGVTGPLFLGVSFFTSITANFGQSTFAHTPPSGFEAGWFESEPEEEAGLWVCGDVSAGACISWVALVDEVATFAELGIEGSAVALAFGFGFGSVIVIFMFGLASGQIHLVVKRTFGGRQYDRAEF